MSAAGEALRASAGSPAKPELAVRCEPMTAATRGAALALLGEFLHADPHYRANASVYGDGGGEALSRALDLFLARPELGFVWLAFAVRDGASNPAAACVVCHAISTSRGGIVAKLDDVTVAHDWQRSGVGSAMLAGLAAELRARGVTRIDTACHRDNAAAWRFYARAGFRPLDEERITLLLA
jgi:ribosomal protein S18 acetylase RimI-like enzyme